MRKQRINTLARRYAPKADHFAFRFIDDPEGTCRLVIAPETPVRVSEVPGELEDLGQSNLFASAEGLALFSISMRSFRLENGRASTRIEKTWRVTTAV